MQLKISLLVSLLFFISACGGGGGSGPSNPPPVTPPVTPPPPPPPSNEVAELALTLDVFTFPTGITKALFVADDTLMATNDANDLFVLNPDQEWQASDIKAFRIVQVDDALLTSSGMISYDNGLSWEESFQENVGIFKLSPVGNDLYGARSEEILRSSDLGQSWEVVASFPTTVFHYEFVRDDLLIVTLAGASDNLALVDLSTGSVEFVVTENKLFNVTKAPSGALIGVGSLVVYVSEDDGQTWQPILNEAGESAYLNTLRGKVVGDRVYLLDTRGIHYVNGDNQLVSMADTGDIGMVSDVVMLNGRLYVATQIGLYNADGTAVIDRNEFQSDGVIGLPSSTHHTMLTTGSKDFYVQSIPQDSLLSSMDENLDLYTGIYSTTSIIDEDDTSLFVSYRSNTHVGDGGIGRYQKETGQLQELLVDHTVHKAAELSNRIFVHYTESLASTEPNGILVSEDDGMNWQELQIEDISGIHAIEISQECGLLYAVAERTPNNILIANDGSDATSWDIVLQSDDINNVALASEMTVAWSDDNLFISGNCGAEFETLDIAGFDINITELVVSDNVIYFATSGNELWRVKDGEFAKQTLPSSAVKQLFVSQENKLHILTYDDDSFVATLP